MVNLAPYNTFQVSCFAKEFLELNSLDDFPRHSGRSPESPLVLGLGANVLFTKNYDGLVIKNNLKGIKEIGDGLFEVASGENWIDFVNFTVNHGWSGLENLAYIPGTVGAAPVQNIAAYGQTVGEVIFSVSGLNFETLKLETLSDEDCKFYYRNSVFKNELKNKFLVTSVVFKLSKIVKFDTNYYGRRPNESLQAELDKISPPPYTPKIIAQAVTNQRKIKLPDWKTLGTAGSFFKNPFVPKEKFSQLQSEIEGLIAYPVNAMLYPNPDDPVFKLSNMVKIPAGHLLDKLGWRGKRIGNVGTYEKHALIVINYGGATGSEILDFTQKMQEDVKNAYDIDLEPEVNII